MAMWLECRTPKLRGPRFENYLSKILKKRNCTIHVAKTKALISCAVSAHLICSFVFAYACCFFFTVSLTHGSGTTKEAK